MIGGIYSVASAAMAALRHLDALSNNLANSGTSGFKAQMALHSADHAGARGQRGDLGLSVARAQLSTDHTQGSLERTGNPFDLAISGEGFFVVNTPEGDRLTRRGSFHVDAAGKLATAEGYRVQGEGGDITIGDATVTTGSIEIGSDGTIQSGQNRIGKIRVVTVADPQSLGRTDGAGFDPGEQALTPAKDTEIVQASLEHSNVSPVQNLVKLIEVMRGFEAYMSASQRFDAANERAVTDIGRV